MALGTRYTFNFRTVKDAEEFSITIKQEGYGGSHEALAFMPGRDFVTLSYDKTNTNILWPIRGSQLTIKISLAPSQIAEFILADNRTWFIEVFGTAGFEWYGWLQPQTSANYTPYGLKELELQFSDNLGALQTTPDTVLSTSFIALQSLSDMIERQLSYTEISLPVTFDTSVKHAGEPTDFIQDTVFLEQILCNDYNGEQPQMSYDLLSKMLRLMHSVVYQKQGNWVIENFIDKYQSATPTDLFDSFQVLSRGLNIRFESPLSKVTARSYHYNVKHVISNRDFLTYIPTGPNKGFLNWEQIGSLATEMFDLFQSGGINYFEVLGNYVSSNSDSHDYYFNDNAVQVTEGSPIKLYLNYLNDFSGAGTVNPRVALEFTAGANVYYLNTDNEWELTGTPVILEGDTQINNAKSVSTLAPETGFVTIRIYRPSVPSLGTTYNSSTPYIRYSYADFGVGKNIVQTDYKLFKSIGTKNNKGVRENEKFETIGLAFDNEFYPQPNSLLFDQYVCLLYDSTGTRLSGDFISDYMPTSQPWGPTEFASNTYMRLFAKPQLYVEVDLYGKRLNVGDVYTIDIPGFTTALNFVVLAFDWNIKNDSYSALLAYIDYDSTNNINQERVWLQQSQDDPDKE